MSLEPQKFFIGLLDIFSILLPGALITFVMMGGVGPQLFPDQYKLLIGGAGTAAFLFSSYLVGHLVNLVGALLLDDFYDWARRYDLGMQVERVARARQPLPRFARFLAWCAFKRESGITMRTASDLKSVMLKGIDGASVNTFQWSKAYLAIESEASLAAVQRFEADSKFFRSFVIVLMVLIANWTVCGNWQAAGAALCVLPLALWRYVDQRLKSTNQAYWSVIALCARSGKVSLDSERTHARTPDRAGGVVVRAGRDGLEFLAVEETIVSKHLVLPKGHIERGESPEEAAIREVLEEAGVWSKIVDDLGVLEFTENGNPVRSRMYLMKFLTRGKRGKRDRHAVWLTLDEAERRMHPESRVVLKRAAAQHGRPSRET